MFEPISWNRFAFHPYFLHILIGHIYIDSAYIYPYIFLSFEMIMSWIPFVRILDEFISAFWSKLYVCGLIPADMTYHDIQIIILEKHFFVIIDLFFIQRSVSHCRKFRSSILFSGFITLIPRIKETTISDLMI